jgi:hypothetical protein
MLEISPSSKAENRVRKTKMSCWIKSSMLFVLSKAMKQVVLYFPNNTSLAEFILSQRVSGVETKASDASLRGRLTHQQIMTACSSYGAVLESKLIGEWEEKKG